MAKKRSYTPDTGSEIKTLYEGEADTNAFTDAEKSKLSALVSDAIYIYASVNDATGDESGDDASNRILYTDMASAFPALNEGGPRKSLVLDMEGTISGRWYTFPTQVTNLDIFLVSSELGVAAQYGLSGEGGADINMTNCTLYMARNGSLSGGKIDLFGGSGLNMKACSILSEDLGITHSAGDDMSFENCDIYAPSMSLSGGNMYLRTSRFRCGNFTVAGNLNLFASQFLGSGAAGAGAVIADALSVGAWTSGDVTTKTALNGSFVGVI